jgi:protein SCO1/2
MLVAACNRTRKYPMQGEVIATDAATNELTVKHGDIPGFMEAMTMPYPVKDPAVVREVQPGDKIAAEVVVGSDRTNYWLEDVRITDESGRVQADPAAKARMLMPGERVPDIAFTNQDGRTIHLPDFAGKALLVTFIYTRCPMPDFCPRLSSQFAKIQDELKENPALYGKTHLLTITLDPKYDTPTVLRKYGRLLPLGFRLPQSDRPHPAGPGVRPYLSTTGEPDTAQYGHRTHRAQWDRSKVLVDQLDLGGTERSPRNHRPRRPMTRT